MLNKYNRLVLSLEEFPGSTLTCFLASYSFWICICLQPHRRQSLSLLLFTALEQRDLKGTVTAIRCVAGTMLCHLA